MDFCFKNEKMAQNLSRLSLENGKQQGGVFLLEGLLVSLSTIIKCPVGRPRHSLKGHVASF